jgi:hypothetical protein
MSSSTVVVRRFLGEGVALLMGDDLRQLFSSLSEMARGSGELKMSSSSGSKEGDRGYWVEVIIVASKCCYQYENGLLAK